ncbi:hypothetical protein [Streptomyces sp. yr375]|nr:hypothetical protein [Streptomyces sp. yr375]
MTSRTGPDSRQLPGPFGNEQWLWSDDDLLLDKESRGLSTQ